MEVPQMREALCKRYPSSAWAKKVRKMPDDQVIAVFMRLQQAGLFGQARKPVHVPTPPRPTVFYCKACKKFFAADNPDLTECRFCGGPLTKRMTEYIEKDVDNED